MSLGRPAIELAFLPIMFFAVLRAEHLEKQKSLVVSVNGSTEYKSVQQAVDALPQEGGVIKILPGNYRVVTINKPHVRMEGDKADPTKVVIVFNNSHGKVGSTLKSATVSVLGDDFFAEGITFANDFSAGKPLAPEDSQAVALLVKGDAQTYFENCQIHAIAHETVFLTAQSEHYPDEDSGYVLTIAQLPLRRKFRNIFGEAMAAIFDGSISECEFAGGHRASGVAGMASGRNSFVGNGFICRI